MTERETKEAMRLIANLNAAFAASTEALAKMNAASDAAEGKGEKALESYLADSATNSFNFSVSATGRAEELLGRFIIWVSGAPFEPDGSTTFDTERLSAVIRVGDEIWGVAPDDGGFSGAFSGELRLFHFPASAIAGGSG